MFWLLGLVHVVAKWAQSDGNGDDDECDQGSNKTTRANIMAVRWNVVDVSTSSTVVGGHTDTWTTSVGTVGFSTEVSFISVSTAAGAFSGVHVACTSFFCLPHEVTVATHLRAVITPHIVSTGGRVAFSHGKAENGNECKSVKIIHVDFDSWLVQI